MEGIFDIIQTHLCASNNDAIGREKEEDDAWTNGYQKQGWYMCISDNIHEKEPFLRSIRK